MSSEINKDEKIPTPEELGIPDGSFDPMKTIRMEGDLYRGLLNTRHHSLFLRIMSIMFAVLFFIIPALLILYFVFFGSQEAGVDVNFIRMLKAALDSIFFLGSASSFFSFKIFMLIYAAISFSAGVRVIAGNVNKISKNNINDK